MATKRPTKPRQTLLQEASDPSTDPAILRELADSKNEALRRAAIRNPSLPEDAWRKALMQGEPVAWANPMAHFYLLAWTPREDDERTLELAAQMARSLLLREPNLISQESKALLNAKLQEWWSTTDSAANMMIFLAGWAYAKRVGSPEHREVVRILVLCVRTYRNLTDGDHQALDLLDAWCADGKDRHKEAYALASSTAVINTVRFTKDALTSMLSMIYAKPYRPLADLIRREMPLPPVVE
jgi:hypothetical protein